MTCSLYEHSIHPEQIAPLFSMPSNRANNICLGAAHHLATYPEGQQSPACFQKKLRVNLFLKSAAEREPHSDIQVSPLPNPPRATGVKSSQLCLLLLPVRASPPVQLHAERCLGELLLPLCCPSTVSTQPARVAAPRHLACPPEAVMLPPSIGHPDQLPAGCVPETSVQFGQRRLDYPDE